MQIRPRPPPRRHAHETAFRRRFDVPAVRAREQFHARRVARDLRPVDRPGRRRAVQGRAAVFRRRGSRSSRSSAAGWSRCRSRSTARTGSRTRRFDVEFHVRHIACRTRATGGSSASRWRASTRGRSTAASRCGRPTSSRACTTSRACRPAASRCTRKMHHAIVDGESGTEIMRALHSLTPGTDRFRRRGTERERALPRRPRTDTGRAYSRALVAQRARSCRRWRASRSAPRASRVARRRCTDQDSTTGGQGGFSCQPALAAVRRPEPAAAAHAAADAFQRRRVGAPRVRSGGPAARGFPGDPPCRSPKATINDLFLASSAARCAPTCRAKKELPDATMVADGADDAARRRKRAATAATRSGSR